MINRIRKIAVASLLLSIATASQAASGTNGTADSAHLAMSPAPSSQTMPSRAAGYDVPPKDILDILHAPRPPTPVVSPTGGDILLVSSEVYPPLSRVAEPYLRLAGVRVEPRTRRKHDTPGGYGVSTCIVGYTLVHVASGGETPVSLPAGGCPTSPIWSADGKHFAFWNTSNDAVELWIGETVTGSVNRVDGVRLNPMMGSSTVQWMADQQTLVVKLVPADQGPAPLAMASGEGPSIQETNGQRGESSTYEARDTLNNSHDEDLFDYYATSQLALIDVNTGKISPIGKPGIFVDVDLAPDGRHLLIESLHRPYSYLTTFERFPRTVEIWNNKGEVVHTVATLPLADRVPVHGVPIGPRDFSWRATDPATLVWAEALDGGDWNVNVAYRDKVMMQKSPFSKKPTEVTRTEQRYAGITWSQAPSFALLGDFDLNRHWQRTFIVNVDWPGSEKKVLFDLSSDELYENPGDPITRTLPNGVDVLRQVGNCIYLAGAGASPDGDRPFLDSIDIVTRKSERLFRSEKNDLDRFLAFAPDGMNAFMTWHQSLSDPPNAFLRSFGVKSTNVVAGEAVYATNGTAITHIPDPTPSVRAIKKTLVKYKRADGVDLSFTMYTPPDYKPGTRIPAILYAYPLDYADPSKAGQVSGSEQTFTVLRNYRLLLLAGYAVIDNASFPIVGDPKKAYDTYLDQLVEDAQAAVDKAVEMGIVDPDRVGVTGHSHGALMTVNLLAHSNLFRAGVATSGSYNKTLTPFGFQNERRSVWEAQPVYVKVSPFFVADKIKLPLLLVHGSEDANPGTTPLQASKLYEAVRGNGGTARLVMLPHEPHWYAAIESNEQLMYEMVRWFDTYVKNALPKTGANY